MDKRKNRYPSFKAYEKSTTELSVMIDVCLVDALESYLRLGYLGLLATGHRRREMLPVLLSLLLKNQNRQNTIASLYDRTETLLEKLTIGQSAAVWRQLESAAAAKNPVVEKTLIGIAADHEKQYRFFSHKLAHKEGLSPMGLPPALNTGRGSAKLRLKENSLNRIEAYDKKSTLPVTKIAVRSAAALETWYTNKLLAAVGIAEDRHLSTKCRKISQEENLHIIALAALPDKRETVLEDTCLRAAAVVAGCERAVVDAKEHHLITAFEFLLQSARTDLETLIKTAAAVEGIEADSFQPWPVVEPISDPDVLMKRLTASLKNKAA